MGEDGSSTREKEGDAASEGGPLRARLTVDPPEEAACGLLSGPVGQVVSHQLKFNRSEGTNGTDVFECGQCHAEVVYHDRSDRMPEYCRSAVTEQCPCQVLADDDCLRDVVGVEDGSLLFEVTVPAREELRRVVADIREIGASVSVRWIVTEAAEDLTVEVDVSDITPKQREAVRRALDAGYYDDPRTANLEALAADLDITESAVSWRLNTAERTLIRALFEE